MQRGFRSSALNAGFFDFLTGGPKKSASASHILIKGPDAEKTCLALKAKLAKASPKLLQQEFASLAAANSACPSKNKGGSLGKFSQGQMVPQFDKVVFNDAVGVVHGPVKTAFGAHLILITNRE